MMLVRYKFTEIIISHSHKTEASKSWKPLIREREKREKIKHETKGEETKHRNPHEICYEYDIRARVLTFLFFDRPA